MFQPKIVVYAGSCTIQKFLYYKREMHLKKSNYNITLEIPEYMYISSNKRIMFHVQNIKVNK